MDGKFFRIPFADSGDKTTVPDDAQVDGSVSYDEGFGPDYALEQGTDPDALDVPRNKTNELFYDITNAIQLLQTLGAPGWITASDNDGTSYPYAAQALVRYNDTVWISLVDSNTATPGTDATKWTPIYPQALWRTGDVKVTQNTTLESGWVWSNGTTIGDASSGATGRANDDTEDLFTMYWNGYTNTVLPIQDSSGAPSTRGASAAADFAAHKRMPTVDLRGRTMFGKDDMGGASAAGRLTGATAQGIVGNIIGNSGGEQAHTPTVQETAAHTHGVGTLVTDSAGAHNHTVSGKYVNVTGTGPTGTLVVYTSPSGLDTAPTSTAGTHTHTLSGASASTGSGNAFNVINPGAIVNIMVKL